MGERCVRNAEVRGSIPLSSMPAAGGSPQRSVPRGVTGNTSDSGSEESRFEPWRGNFKRVNVLRLLAWFIPVGPARDIHYLSVLGVFILYCGTY